MSAAAGATTARKAWTTAKVYAALRDLPEVLPLFFLVGGVFGLAGYTCRRVYFSVSGEQFVRKDMRNDYEKQISYGQDHRKPSILESVSEWKRDSDGYIDVAVWPFSNATYKGGHNVKCHAPVRKGVQSEGASPTEY